MLRSQLGVQGLADRLFDQRFLSNADTLQDPNVFPDMEKAVERIRQALEVGEQVGIIGDYDCDGITATAQLVRLFERHGIQPFVRLPHRVRDGYGVHNEMIAECHMAGVTLLLTVDTGIAAHEEVAEASARGIDVIVTDHHSIPQTLPDAYAILHPELAPQYPAPHPSGAGVVYQLLRGVQGESWDDQATDAALAMIGTIADVVELRGDNRTLVQWGLQCLPTLAKNHPIRMLLEQAKLNATETRSTDIAFRVAPRINASGRMDDPHLALDALLAGGNAVATLQDLNTERQEQTEKCMQAVLQDLGLEAVDGTKHSEGPGHPEPASLLCSASEHYPTGIVGLIAGRLTERFGRPSMIATVDGDVCTASLRSPTAYNITAGLERCKDLLEGFGGHAQAAGCTVKRSNWDALCARLAEDITARTEPDDLLPTLVIDATLDPRDIMLELLEDLERLEPYGQGNREPLFLLQNVQLESLRTVGEDDAHLQCTVGNLKAIGFRMGHALPLCQQPVDLVCRLQIDTWQGWRKPQLIIVNMQ